MGFTYPAAMWSGALPAHVMSAMVEWASNQVRIVMNIFGSSPLWLESSLL